MSSSPTLCKAPSCQYRVSQVAACPRIGGALQQALSVTDETQNHHPLLGYNPLLVFILIRVTTWCDQSAKACLKSPSISMASWAGAETASAGYAGRCLQTARAGLTTTRTLQPPYLIWDIRDGALTISQSVLKNKTLESDFRVRSKSTSYSCDSSARVDISSADV